MKEFEYDINAVVGRLSAKIANLEAEIAHEQAKNEALVGLINESVNKEEEEVIDGA